MMGRSRERAETAAIHDRGRGRPEHFSTYVPRAVVRRLKVVATIRDVPLWALVTQALEEYLDAFQLRNGRLPELEQPSDQGGE